MNPLGFFGTAVGLQLGATATVIRFRPVDEVLGGARQLAPTYFWLLDLLSSQLEGNQQLMRALEKKGVPVPEPAGPAR
jgi:hypothetical protein